MPARNNLIFSEAEFELNSLKADCPKKTCHTTIDLELQEKLRDILSRNIAFATESGAKNGAIVVIKLPENEILALVGSPNPKIAQDGSMINMATEPRPIGSTVKPFIYLEGFKKGLRPYSLVDDREYKYPVSLGFPLYPKNYDGKYRGIVSLQESLSNSLNVPAVKTLEFVGLPEFYRFLERDMMFHPIQELESYQYGIALGGLEMDILTLSHYLSIFPNAGTLRPLTLIKNNGKYLSPMSGADQEKKISEPEYVQLVTKILSDRKLGVEQFGLKSNLNLPQDNYAVKTGTSRDYHDSWTIGYTPDFLVAVWLGNAENKPLKQLSGQSGAGKIWHEAMELIINSPYNKKTPFDFARLKSLDSSGKLSYGLPGDNIEKSTNLLIERDNNLIISPHDQDNFLFSERMEIPLKSKRPAVWRANGEFLSSGQNSFFSPGKPGKYELEASSSGEAETIVIFVEE
ncbi:hypothetical protein C4572_00375 [Candidatus Parcubacteria bacterium]|nr:MAG: hypothetical protein C4572_00375 [Candidatus Parcubacteria bacterium]